MDNDLRILSASISDRGLSEKRPQNEDSFLEMKQCGLFAVADGVGGAQAGEVASQMAVEMLGEAFANRAGGSDAVQVMRAAVEQANTAIYQMAQELPQLSTMATTLVALHLAGNIATIAHVGDSRLYRVDKDGELYRETDDHSMVADEVRAGRMTVEQAENHPSRNIISRALGAESTVDVDIKTRYVDGGTAFLICSDGITRHVMDEEIKGVLTFGGDPDEICSYLKTLCFERGAEDNLTAVVVKIKREVPVSAPAVLDDHLENEEPTIATSRLPAYETPDGSGEDEILELGTNELDRPNEARSDGVVSKIGGEKAAIPSNEQVTFESLAKPIVPAFTPENPPPIARNDSSSMFGNSGHITPSRQKEGPGKIVLGLAMLLVGTIIGLTMYHVLLRSSALPAGGQLTQMRAENIPLTAFEENRRDVDKDPAGYINKFADSPRDCEDFYLLGRAYLLTGDYPKARSAFTESRDRLAGADPANSKILASDIAIAMAVTNDTTIQTNLKKEIDATVPSASGDSAASP